MMLKRHHWNHSRCPLCGAEEETTKHVLRCPDIRAQKTWRISLGKLKIWMELQNTHPALQRHILKHLQAWHDQVQLQPRREAIGRLAQALSTQDNIGWFNFLLGRTTTLFAEIQQRHYESLQSKKTGFRWHVALINKLFGVAWDMWEHRNGILHGDEDNHHHKQMVEEANLEIHQQFQLGKGTLLPKDRKCLRHKRTLLSKPLMDKQRWLDSQHWTNLAKLLLIVIPYKA